MKTLRLIALSSMILASSNSAYALSCSRDGFDLAKTYKHHAAAAETYMFVIGRFAGSAPKRPRGSNQDQPTLKTSLKFKGSSIRRSGLGRLSKPVTLVSTCVGSWCGSAPPANQKIIAAVRVESGGKLTLHAGPCSPNQFQGSTSNVRLIQSCMNGAACN